MTNCLCTHSTVGNKRKNNPPISAWTVRHSSTYIILYIGYIRYQAWENRSLLSFHSFLLTHIEYPPQMTSCLINIHYVTDYKKWFAFITITQNQRIMRGKLLERFNLHRNQEWWAQWVVSQQRHNRFPSTICNIIFQCPQYNNQVIKSWRPSALQWRHNDRDGVWNHQPHDCLLNRLFRRRSKKTSKLRVTGLCEGNSPVTGEFPAKWPVTRKMFPFDDVIMDELLRQ